MRLSLARGLTAPGLPTWWSVQQAAFRGNDSDSLEEFWVGQRQLDHLQHRQLSCCWSRVIPSQR